MNVNKNTNVNKLLETKNKFGYKHILIGLFIFLSSVIISYLYFNNEINNFTIISPITSIFYLFNKKNAINIPVSSLYIEPILNVDNNNKDEEENLNNIEVNNNVNNKRILSLKTDLFTGENTQTYRGQVPLISCPKGFYRPVGATTLTMITGQRQDGCEACPRGKYGAQEGLTSPLCTAPCPAGKYSDILGITGPMECKLCAPGKYASQSGSSTHHCTAKCTVGKYSNIWGATKKSDCKECPTGYRGWQCTWAIQPSRGQDQDHQNKEIFGLSDSSRQVFNDPIPN